MRLTAVVLLLLCGFLCTGCESLNKTARGWPRKDPNAAEQLAHDQQRREAAEKQVAVKTPPAPAGKISQQSNFSPAPIIRNDSVDNTLLRAKQAEQGRQNPAAKSLYEQVLVQQPQNAEAHHRLGVLADQDGRYGDAQQHYQAALQQQPQNASLLSDVGYSFYSQDRLNEAEQYLVQALRVQPENQYARNNLAQVYGRRAVQTGSAADIQLAKDQFTLALGPQGAEQQMQQLFPQSGNGAGERRGFPNPFKKQGQDRTIARTGSDLQAPRAGKNEDGNAALLRQMDQIRAQMHANGELPTKRPTDPRITAGRSSANVPLDRMNDELSRIDIQAARQQEMAIRQAYPSPQRKSPGLSDGNWSGIEQTANTNQQPSGYGQGDGAITAGGEYGFQSSMPNVRNSMRGWDQSGPGINGQAPDSQNNQIQRANGAGNTRNTVPGWDPESAGTGMSTSWPDTRGAANQFDARGQAWDGQALMQNPVSGGSPNQAYEANDPTYFTRQGSTFGAQRPNPQPGRGTAGRGPSRVTDPQAWDDGRQTAAQLGLDAGMGDMFPGSPQERQYGGAGDAGNWGGTSNLDPGLYGTPTTRRGIPAGGAANVAPADYRAAPPNYQYNGFSQGINPAMGENYGGQGSDVNAPWTQAPNMGTRNSRAVNQMDYQFQNDSGYSAGQFAPNHQSSPPQNFGAPPMYYGR